MDPDLIEGMHQCMDDLDTHIQCTVQCMSLIYHLFHAVLSLANALSSHAGLTVRIASIRHCNALFYSQLLARLMDIELSPLSTEEARCQAVVDALSNHLSPQISLDHIKASIATMQCLLSYNRHFKQTY